jgi:predicted enzyme related to lactoylglutathione lyase
MADAQGNFVWYELMTTDIPAAQAFYGKAVGWGAMDAQMPGMTYILLTAGDVQVGGIMDLPEDAKKMGAPPSWIGYVAVPDVDAAAAQVKQLGGAVYVEPADIPNVGRFSVVADPQGVTFALFHSSHSGDGEMPPPGTPGRVGWHELMTSDWEAAFAFYNALLGWQKDEALDMGPMGTYQLFQANGRAIGGMMNRPPNVPVSRWRYYFNVDEIDAATARVTAAGGEVQFGPSQVPGGDWIIQGLDPQGAAFALVGRRG